MKITIEIGPNRVTRTLSRIRYGFKGFKAYWKEFNRDPASTVKVKSDKLAA